MKECNELQYVQWLSWDHAQISQWSYFSVHLSIINQPNVCMAIYMYKNNILSNVSIPCTQSHSNKCAHHILCVMYFFFHYKYIFENTLSCIYIIILVCIVHWCLPWGKSCASSSCPGRLTWNHTARVDTSDIAAFSTKWCHDVLLQPRSWMVIIIALAPSSSPITSQWSFPTFVS